MKNKIIAILGPTSCGKSDMAVKVALRLNSEQVKKQFRINGAEIISADSRQVYKGMDIGSGKITKKEMRGVPHHLLDVASPKRKFTVSQYRKLALKSINQIFKKNKIVIICGGTIFYMQVLLDNISIPEVKPNWSLRKKLEKKTAEKLFARLRKLDINRASNIDKNNKRRLIRAIEIALETKRPIKPIEKNPLPYPLLKIGIKKRKEEIKKLIKKRLSKRMKNGMIKEVKILHKKGLSFKRLEEFGLEYQWISEFLQEKISKKGMIEKIQKSSERLAKNQINWLKKDDKIKWIKNYREAEKEVKKFLSIS